MYRVFSTITMAIGFVVAFAMCSFAVDATSADASRFLSYSAIAAGLGIGVAAFGVAIGQGMAIAKAMESVGRNPECSSKLQTLFILGLAFLETCVIYALIIALALVFFNPLAKFLGLN